MDIEMIRGRKRACYIGMLDEYGQSHGRGKRGRTSAVSIGQKHSKMDIFRASSHSHLPYLWMVKFPQTYLHKCFMHHFSTCLLVTLKTETVWFSKPSEQSTVHDVKTQKTTIIWTTENPKLEALYSSFGPL
jgi:hypothetical protein